MSIAISGQTITVSSRNVIQVTVSYYEVDLEILFSKDPFFNKDMTSGFNNVQPTTREVKTIKSDSSETKTEVAIPAHLKSKNLVVYVQTDLISEKIRYIPTDLRVIVSSDSGYLKVTDPATKKPLSKIYVKTFS